MILRLIRDALESEDSNARAVEIQGYLPEALESMNEFYPSSSVSDRDSDASEGEGGGGHPQRTETRIKRCTEHHRVSQYYLHAFLLV